MRSFSKPTPLAADSTGHFAFDPSQVSLLACPACLGDLRLDEGSLVCAGCGRAYPIVDGIPALVLGREKKQG